MWRTMPAHSLSFCARGSMAAGGSACCPPPALLRRACEVAMRVLVTGSKGQVVTALAEAGPARGFEIVARGRPELELAAPGSIAAVLARSKPDLVVNAAAYTAVDKAESEADDAYAVN